MADTETCNHPGCTRPIGNYMWGCDQHWFALPVEDRITIYTREILTQPVAPAEKETA